MRLKKQFWITRLARSVSPARAERISVLAVASLPRDRIQLGRLAQFGNWRLEFAETCSEADLHLRHAEFAVVLLDREFPILDWRAALTLLVAAAPHASFLLTSPVNDEYLVREVVLNGGYDVLTTPFEDQQALHAVNLAWAYAKSRARS